MKNWKKRKNEKKGEIWKKWKNAKLSENERKWRKMKENEGKWRKMKENDRSFKKWKIEKKEKKKKKKGKYEKKWKNEKKWKKMKKWKKTKNWRKMMKKERKMKKIDSHAKSSTISRIYRCCCNFFRQNPRRFPWFCFGMCLFPEENQQPVLGCNRFSEEKWQFSLDVKQKHTFYRRKSTKKKNR